MNKNVKFCICNQCGNLAGMIENKGPKLSCCGQVMSELIANTTEASTEKHIPVINIDNNTVNIQVGSALHPMAKEHYIGWVYLLTTKGGQRKNLDIDSNPIVQFELSEDDKVVAAYAYCNIHGLWKVEI